MPRVLKPGKGAIGLTYDQALATEICERVVGCETLAQICKSSHMPKPGAVYAWMRDNEEFCRAFKEAKRIADNKVRVNAEARIEPTEVRMGRPTDYSEELAEYILSLVEDGMLLSHVCRQKGMPRYATLWRWKERYPEFGLNLSRAMLINRSLMVEEGFDIADDASNDYTTKTNRDGSEYEAFDTEHVRRSALRIDYRKWYVGCHDPMYRQNTRVDIYPPGAVAPTQAAEVTDNMKAIEGYEVFQKLIKGE